MKIEGLKPTHVDMHTGMDYARHEGVWYFVKPLSFNGLDYEWTESYDYNNDSENIELFLKELK